MSSTATAFDYWKEVRSLAEEALGFIREGMEESEAVDNAVDGNQWVIYTAMARKVIEYSPNDCAYFDDFGSVEVSNWGELFSCAADWAMRADVMEAMQTARDEEE